MWGSGCRSNDGFVDHGSIDNGGVGRSSVGRCRSTSTRAVKEIPHHVTSKSCTKHPHKSGGILLLNHCASWLPIGANDWNIVSASPAGGESHDDGK